MFQPETVKFLESGCALVVGTVDAGGAPHASRGWSLRVLHDDDTGGGARVRLLVDCLETASLENLATTAVIAITGTNVPTLHSVQLKGRVLGTKPANDTDRANAAAFLEAFYGDIHETDGTERALLDRMTPSDFVAVDVVVEEIYDQTPGPGAGAAMSASQS